MAKKRKTPLTEEEIWDDSALIQSWDDALEEYQLYHSIHARGERVEDVLLAAEALEQNQMTIDNSSLADDGIDLPKNRKGDDSLEDGELEGSEPFMQNIVRAESGPERVPPIQPRVLNGTRETPATKPPEDVSSTPQTIVSASTKDEALKNLMMSWYWAGYYTGYYEGQQRAPAPAETSGAAE